VVRGLVLLLALLAAACSFGAKPSPDGRVRAHIAEDVEIALPSPPSFPETRTLHQIVRAQYGERSAAFESVVSLSPETVSIVITAIGGPRVATITWDASGVQEERTVLAPGGVPVENILADMFLSIWPEDAVRAALPEGVELAMDEDGGRALRRGEESIVEIMRDPANASRTVVKNHAFGYEVAITSQTVE
jgi:hypothetical protein